MRSEVQIFPGPPCVPERIRGAVAQLGERGLCKPEVVGSNPISSTNMVMAGGSERTSMAETFRTRSGIDHPLSTRRTLALGATRNSGFALGRFGPLLVEWLGLVQAGWPVGLTIGH